MISEDKVFPERGMQSVKDDVYVINAPIVVYYVATQNKHIWLKLLQPLKCLTIK